MSAESVVRRILSSDGRWIFIRVEEERFMFNLKILIESSKYFEAMFSGRFEESAENEIVMEDVGLAEFRLFHEWIFGLRNGSIDENDSLLQLILFADRFMIEGLRKRVIEDINAILDIVSCPFACKILQTSIQIGDLELKNIFIDWINKRFPKRNTDTLHGREIMFLDTISLVKLCKTLGEHFSELSTEADEELNQILVTPLQNKIVEYELSLKESSIKENMLNYLKKLSPRLKECDGRLLGLKKFIERTLEENGLIQ